MIRLFNDAALIDKGSFMQIGSIDHFYEIVVPAVLDYEAAENALTQAITSNADDATKSKSRFAALRFGGAAAIYLHHYSDIIAYRPPPNLPNFNGNVGDARAWIGSCMEKRVKENLIPLLRDTADALKHSTLIYGLPREVEERNQVLAVSRGYGEAIFGEGKYGGIDEVWLLGKCAKRPLRLVLSRVAKTWDAALNQECGEDERSNA
jgi:hypothetical protein